MDQILLLIGMIGLILFVTLLGSQRGSMAFWRLAYPSLFTEERAPVPDLEQEEVAIADAPAETAPDRGRRPLPPIIGGLGGQLPKGVRS